MSCLIGGMANDRPADNEVHELLAKVWYFIDFK